MLARSRVALLVFGAMMLCAPFVSYAQTNVDAVADAMCNPVMLQCGCMQKMGKNGCEAGMNKWMCACAGPHASGFCEAPNKCKATATVDGKLDPGMAKLGEMLGKLMEALAKGGGGGGGGGGGESPQPGQQCVTLQPTADLALIQSNPACYYYQQPTDLGSTNAIDPSGGLVATPTDGPAPLTVFFAFTNGNSGCNTPVLNIDYGDGKVEAQQTHSGTACSGISDTTQHTYTTAGQFPARLLNANTGEVRGGVNITVAEGAESTPAPNATTSTGGTNTTTNTGSTGFTSGNSTNIGNTSFNTPLTNLGNSGSVSTGGSSGNFSTGNYSTGGSASTGGSNDSGAALNFNTPQSIVQSIIQKNLPPGAYGDVKILDNGTTIVAGVRENNTEVAGFFGSGGGSGQGQSTAARMCNTRPWASNFLSYIIPPSFFDSLCTWRGFTVGKTQSQTTTPSTITTGTQPSTVKTGTTTSKPPVKATSSPAALSDAKVDIWASPATVPLGARTSVFWNTQGVSECLITSPDGSFTQTSLKGGASTVPLTAPTIFTISCVAPNGAHLTDDITVQIAL